MAKVRLLVAVRKTDVREVSVEWHATPQDTIGDGERCGKGVDTGKATIAGGMHVGEVDHRSHPVEMAGDGDNVIEIAQLLHPPHHLDPEIDGPSLGRETVRNSVSWETTAASASSRDRPSKKPGWITTGAASQAAARPAVWSSMPTAI